MHSFAAFALFAVQNLAHSLAGDYIDCLLEQAAAEPPKFPLRVLHYD